MRIKTVLPFVFSVFVFQTVIGQQTLLTPGDVARIKYVSQVVTSSDGRYVAYAVNNQADPYEKNVAASNYLHVYDVANKRSVPFYSQASVSSIRFRPGTGAITFLAKGPVDKARSLYEISLSGGEAVKLYEHPTAISKYDWSGSGKLLIVAEEKTTKSKSVLPYEPEIYEENLTFSRIYLVDLKAKSAKQADIELEGHVSDAKWSPDEAQLAVVAAPTPLVDDSYMKQSIYFVNVEYGHITGQVDHSGKLGDFEWSPDGNYLAFIAGAHVNDPIDGRLLAVDTKSGTPVNLIPDFMGMFEKLAWKDNNTLHYLSSEGVYSGFGTVGIDDDATMDPSIEAGKTPVFTNFSAKNGVTAFIGHSPTHPPELFLMTKKDNLPGKITDSNPWLANRILGKQEVIRYKAQDGVEIEGIIIRPVREQQGRKYPMITVVHGGPESHYDNGWLTRYSAPGHVGAADGFVVFYPNYRGSTGRGLEFAMSSQADLAGKEFDDIVDGVDYLIESGLVDGSKVGVTGASYGGYATAWLSTKYSDRFAAGIMFVGISNNISKWGTSDIPEELYEVHARKRVWDDYDFFMDRSPIKYVDNAKTPLLILHGKNDTRVYPGQSMELYRHIKTRTDTPVRLVFYTGEGHGNRRSSARFDYNHRMMRWFSKYLQDPEIDLDTTIDLPERN